MHLHEWAAWSEPTVTASKKDAYQLRTCRKCGKVKLRWLT